MAYCLYRGINLKDLLTKHIQHQTLLILTSDIWVGLPNLNFFLLILKVFLDFTTDTIYIGSEFSYVFLEKGFRLFPTWERNCIAIDPILLLLPAKENLVFEEKFRKQYAVIALASYCLKIVLILLTKVAAFFVQVSILYVRVLYFKELVRSIFSRLLGL